MPCLILMLAFTNIGYPRRAVVSWYGPAFHGRITASGEIFDMYDMTAASTIVPLDRNCFFVNPECGASSPGRINDTGPWKYDSTGHAIFPLEPHPIRKFDFSVALFDILSQGDLDRGTMTISYYVLD